MHFFSQLCSSRCVFFYFLILHPVSVNSPLYLKPWHNKKGKNVCCLFFCSRQLTQVKKIQVIWSIYSIILNLLFGQGFIHVNCKTNKPFVTIIHMWYFDKIYYICSTKENFITKLPALICTAALYKNNSNFPWQLFLSELRLM